MWIMRILRVADMAYAMANTVSVTIAWIPGHQGIQLNDFADRLAKDTAHDIYTGRVSAPSLITFNDAVKIAGDISLKSWQRKWNQDVSGFYTRSLIPEVGRTVIFPQMRNVGISYCRMTPCYLMILIVLVQLIHRFVNADLREKLQNTSYCVVRDFTKHVISCQIL